MNKYISKLTKYSFVLFFIYLSPYGCEQKVKVSPESFKQIVSHRNLGLAYLEEGQLSQASREFELLISLAPMEALGHANLGYTHMRMPNSMTEAEESLKKAVKLSPENPDVRFLLAKVYELNGQRKKAVRLLENALKTHPNHLQSLYQLAIHSIEEGTEESSKNAINILSRVVKIQPMDSAARFRLIELFLRDGNSSDALFHMESVNQILPKLPNASKEIFNKALHNIRNGNTKPAIRQVVMFHNIMRATSFYRVSLAVLRGTNGPISGSPIYRFLQLDPNLYVVDNEIPEGLNFTEMSAQSGLNILSGKNQPSILTIGDVDGDNDQDIFVSQWNSSENMTRRFILINQNGSFVEKTNDFTVKYKGRDESAILGDYDNDGYLDLFVVNEFSNSLYQNMGEGKFIDITNGSGLGNDNGATIALFADLDLEGDLDIFLCTQGKNRLFRNNLDGSFSEIADESGLGDKEDNTSNVIFGDFDDDGDPDLFIINKTESNRYFDNLRGGVFRDLTDQVGLHSESESGTAVAGDYNNDGYLDLFIGDKKTGNHSLLINNGSGSFIDDNKSEKAFKNIETISATDAIFFDADNDGYLDLLIAGHSVEHQKGSGLNLYYNNGSGSFLLANSLLPEEIGDVNQAETFDADNDGDLDIIYVTPNGEIKLLRNNGGNVNNFLVVRLVGLRTGSTKNNYFGIGSKLEVKVGDLYQMRVMYEPLAYFGIGRQDSADVLRVVWNNGVPQNHLKPAGSYITLTRSQTIVEEQILKGSCPWLFTWNGEKFVFSKDVLWASAIGMPIDGTGKNKIYASPKSASEYFKISSNSLKERKEKYQLRFSTQLWETAYLDKIQLYAVDHPENIEIFVDESFPPKPSQTLDIIKVQKKHIPLSAMDEKGNNLIKKILYTDDDYISDFNSENFQGITEIHDLVLELGDLSGKDSIYLFLYGWVFPTDASINVNMFQTERINSLPPQLQVIDQNGQWKTVIQNIGFPKGKNKMVIVNLSDLFESNDYKVRIRTNMQIYWDEIFYVTDFFNDSIQVTALNPGSANLNYKGFSKLMKKTQYSPSIPLYKTISTTPKWRDLVGNYTRYGDVASLLKNSDNQYVIMNAGDEIILEFDVPKNSVLPKGWTRDFIFYNDGWLKDGDLNTAHGQTVKPLPYHGMKSYPYSSDDAYSENDLHTADYNKLYNTREITDEPFKRVIREIIPK
tara:strand:- start:4767 stop:8354 length:3588 start_codon:yes stop_codon:yes gene_type:complete